MSASIRQEQAMMIPDLPGLRAKLLGASGKLGEYWMVFRKLAQAHPMTFPLWPNLAFLVTRERRYVDSIRAIYFDLLDKMPEADFTNDVQFHIWCASFPFARFAIGYDWVADLDVFSPAEQRRLDEMFIRFIYKHPFMRLKGRARLSDNQIMAMTFAVAAVGYLYGQKRGRHPLAQTMWAEAMARWPDFLKAMPAGGYSLEGSTYHCLVVGPAYALWCAFLDDAMGMNVFDRIYPPGKSSIRDILEFTANLVSPGGLLPGWDNYGLMRSPTASPLVYLARRTRDPRPLQLVLRHNMFHEPDHMAWQNDDRMWSLIWWPDDLKIPAIDPARSWMCPEIAAALDDAPIKMRLFQYWDECGGGLHYGREQVNPNSITLEAFGSPLLVDGVPAVDMRPECMAPDVPAVVKYLAACSRRDGKKYGGTEWVPEPRDFAKTLGDGGICSANSIVVDGEGWYGPITGARGKGIAFHVGPGLQVTASEAKDYYHPHYDIESIVRISLLVEGRYVVVADRIAAASAHDFAWQVFTRADAVGHGSSAEVRTKERSFLRITSLHGEKYEGVRVEGYPRWLEEVSHRLRLRKRGRNAAFDVLFQPADLLEPVADLSKGWTLAGTKSPKPIALERFVEQSAALPPDEPRVLERIVTLDDSAPWLAIPEGNLKGIRLSVNGREIPPTLDEGLPQIAVATRLTRTVWDLKGVAKIGKNHFALKIPFFEGMGFAPPIQLCRAVRPPPPSATKWLGPEVLQIGAKRNADRLIVANLQGRTMRLPNLTTDARFGLARGERFTLFAAKTVKQPKGVELCSLRPIDVSWEKKRLWLSGLDGEHSIRLAIGGEDADIVIRDVILIRCKGKFSSRLTLNVRGPMAVFLNDCYLGTFSNVVDVFPRDSRTKALAASGDGVKALDEVHDLRQRGSPHAARRLRHLAADADWPVRAAAVLALGELRHRASTSLLLRILREENKADLYPAVPAWWRWGTMQHRPEAPDAREKMVKTGAAARRYRLIMAVAIALGRIGDRRAIVPLMQQLRRHNDFYPAQSNIIIALGRLQATAAIPLLTEREAKGEYNCRRHAGLVLRYLRGKITRAEFEASLPIN